MPDLDHLGANKQQGSEEKDRRGASPLGSLLAELQRQCAYGSLTLKFEAGKVVIIKKEETLKPQDLSGQPKKQADGNQ